MRKMTAFEKTPVLYCSKSPFEEKEKKRCSSKNIVGWIFITILLLLLIVLLIQIFYSPFNQELNHWTGNYVDEATISTRSKDQDSDFTEVYEGNFQYPWIVNFLIDPSDLCATRNPPDSERYAADPEVKLLMLVPSFVDHFEQRRAIRNTWGSMAEKPFGPMRLAFVLGTTPNRTVDDLVQLESLAYGDIVQADFVDSRRQLTTKSILMLKWVARRCPHAQYFLKADDDTFVNIGNIARILSSEPYISTDKFISGYIETEAHPQRTPDEAFYVSTDDYPGEEYPPYASGSAFVMTIPTAIELFQASQEVKPILPADDVFLTGLCAQHIAAPLVHEDSFLIEDIPSPPSWQAFSALSAVPSLTPDILEHIWDDMLRASLDSVRRVEAAINSTVLLRMKKSV